MKKNIKAIGKWALRKLNFTPTLKLREYLMFGFRDLKHLVGGIIFDLLCRDYHLGKLTFTIPFELTNKTFRGRYFWKTYEQREAEYIEKFLDPSATILELGGCIGVISCLANSKLADRRKHVVIEANPLLIPYLTINRNRNECLYSIVNTIITTGKRTKFYIHNLIVGGSQLRKTDRSIFLPSTTIRKLEKKHKLSFDTLVMDIEGAEKKFIEEFQNDLKNFKTLFIEFHPFMEMLTKKDINDCEKILTKIGFKRRVKDEIYQIWVKPTKQFSHRR